jgi:hypothetical protein
MALVALAACAFVVGSRAKADSQGLLAPRGVTTLQAPAPPDPLRPSASAPPSFAPDLIPPLEPSIDPETAGLWQYLLSAMGDWPKAHIQAAAYEDVALSIAEAVLRSPATGWPSPWNTPEARAVLLASLGYFEGARYASYVDDGRCNRMMRAAWDAAPEESTGVRSLFTGRMLTHKAHPNLSVLSAEDRALLNKYGTCDNGIAYSIFQIHAADLRLSTAALADREKAAEAALAIAKRSIRAGLCGYSGEAWPECPKAHLRLSFALEALRRHPPRSALSLE